MSANYHKIRNGITLKPTAAPSGASGPENGDIYYDSTSNLFEFYQNGSYITIPTTATLNSTYATVSLNNLASTAVNASIIPASNGSVSLGSSSLRWQTLYLNSGIVDGNGNVAISTANKTLTDNGNVISINWTARTMEDNTGATQLSWSTGGVVISTALLPAADASEDVGSASFRWANIRSINSVLYGTSSGTFTMSASATTTSYSVIWPNAQGSANQVLAQSGTPGTLTWTTAVTGAIYRSGSTAIGSSATSQAVSFSSALASSSYGVTATMTNTTDTNPQFIPVTVTAQSTTGFTATWNFPTDTGNYKLSWIAFLNN
jgi:hypothetical protein